MGSVSMRKWPIDLFSDTKTRPSPAMREAMANADVGDEQQDEDPTVAALNERVASLLGKESAVYLPSGTMANLASVLVHCSRGDEILCEGSSHVIHLETGGPAGIAGAMVTPLQGTRGIFAPETLETALRSSRRNAPRPRMVWIEQTTNLGGGAVWSVGQLKEMRAIADARNMVIHIDGARLMNAAIAHQVSASQFGALADSVWIDFTKGLGAPFGAVLAGSTDFIERARRYKHMLGGAMRQAGMMAAGCLYALENNITRLSVDHANAKAFANRIDEIPGVTVRGPVETNIVVFDIADAGVPAARLAETLAEAGIRVGVFGPSLLRAITHLDVDQEQIEEAGEAIGHALRTLRLRRLHVMPSG